MVLNRQGISIAEAWLKHRLLDPTSPTSLGWSREGARLTISLEILSISIWSEDYSLETTALHCLGAL